VPAHVHPNGGAAAADCELRVLVADRAGARILGAKPGGVRISTEGRGASELAAVR